MPDIRRCPECDSTLAADATADGLCPRCLLRLGLALDDEAVETPAETLAGQVRCRLLTLLGAGPHGPVYLAEQDTARGRLVVVKILELDCDAAEAQRRLNRILPALLELDHPGILPVLDGGAGDRQVYLVSPYHAAASLLRHCDRAALPAETRLHMLASVCDTVAFAHESGVVHGHLVADNVLVPARDAAMPRVADFGCAGLAGQPADIAGDVSGLRQLAMEVLSAEVRTTVMKMIEDKATNTAADLARVMQKAASRRW
jgi:serine/threonine protein kinase